MVHFLTRTFRDILYVRVEKLIVHLWRLQHSQTVVWGGSRWDGSWKTPATAAAGAGATPTAATGTADTPRRYANRTPTWTSDLRWRYFAWNWTIPLVMLSTVVATTATMSSNSCKNTIVFIHFTSVLRKQFTANMFLREANSYKWAHVLRNSQLA